MIRRFFRAMVIWCAILAIAVVNGATREYLLFPLLGRPLGLAASGILLSLATLAMAIVSVRWVGVASRRQALATGALWLAATLAFEFGFGLAVRHKSMAEMLAAYRFEGGNLWPVVLLVIFLAPLLALRWRRG